MTARSEWDALSYTTRKEHAASIESAKKAETRARRVDTVLDAITS